ncbi:MAG: hypothetical protein IK093_00330 [Ruminiclostridium sp.]|nr:hypothetical protein [Ruminiclostridium sp.]
MDDLAPQERDIIKLRYGFIDNRVYTLEEVGSMYGIGKERVWQIEEKVLTEIEIQAA